MWFQERGWTPVFEIYSDRTGSPRSSRRVRHQRTQNCALNRYKRARGGRSWRDHFARGESLIRTVDQVLKYGLVSSICPTQSARQRARNEGVMIKFDCRYGLGFADPCPCHTLDIWCLDLRISRRVMGALVTIHNARCSSIRCRRVPITEVYWTISGVVHTAAVEY